MGWAELYGIRFWNMVVAEEGGGHTGARAHGHFIIEFLYLLKTLSRYVFEIWWGQKFMGYVFEIWWVQRWGGRGVDRGGGGTGARAIAIDLLYMLKTFKLG